MPFSLAQRPSFSAVSSTTPRPTRRASVVQAQQTPVQTQKPAEKSPADAAVDRFLGSQKQRTGSTNYQINVGGERGSYRVPNDGSGGRFAAHPEKAHDADGAGKHTEKVSE